MTKQIQNKRKSLGQSVMSTTNKTASASAITAADQSVTRDQSATHMITLLQLSVVSLCLAVMLSSSSLILAPLFYRR